MTIFILVKSSIDKAEMDRSNLLENMVQFGNKIWPKKKEDEEKKNKYFW